MALFNYATRELSAKIVYYGPGLSGKTTNIDMVHRLLKPDQKGRLISLPTETDRTLFFDFLPLDLGQIRGFKVRFHLYTVPGQVFYNATRRLVLQGVDGVVFVADSQADMAQGNEESLKNLVENLAAYGKKLDDLPFVLQYNKRDLSRILSVGEMNARLNRMNAPVVEAIAKDGPGVSETLVAISRLVFSHLRKSLMLPGDAEREESRPAPEAKAEAKAAPTRVEREEPLEEISDIEEIQEAQEAQEVLEVHEVREVREILEEPSGAAAQEVAEEPEPTGTEEAWEEPGSAVAGDAPEAAEVPEEFEILPGAPPIADAPTAPGGAAVPGEEEIEIDIPEPAPGNVAAKGARAVISAEPAQGDLTFLKFEVPHISQEGDAVLPAMFMDGEGNIVRIRIRIRMEEQERNGG